MLNEHQVELLDTIAFVQSKKTRKRITRSALIRECIQYWWEHKGSKEFSDSELTLLNPSLIESIAEAKEDLRAGRTYSHVEMLEELDKD